MARNGELLMIRAGATGSFSLTNLLIAIEYATERGVDVLNISAGTAFDFNNET